MHLLVRIICSLLVTVLLINNTQASELSQLKKANTALTDAYITAKIETKILEAKIIEDESIPLVGINASTENGIVTITGKVKKLSSINIIIHRAEQVSGVRKIISNLVVDNTPPTIQPAG